ncbi:MAG TPA: hypothetical protein DCL15_12500 [Chloroflexi bacterium]|nr:hypothetical protein [Chloroflexota bacterium]HHW86663.1 hypothetical protein [Chloroflexota bacterium]
MTTSRFPEITDELLSAYIDNAVTPGERALVEQAATEDATVAWRLATLRETVTLLRTLPMLSAPRTFVLTPEMVGQSRDEPVATASVVAHSEHPAPLPARQPATPSAMSPGWWERLVDGWRAFWAGGNPVWRNALATSMAALLVLLMLPALLRSNTGANLAVPSMMSQVSQESAAPPASEAMAEVVDDAASVAGAVNPATKQGANATAPSDANEGGAPAVSATAAPLAANTEGAPMATSADAEVVVAAAPVRVIPGERATEDALSGIAGAEDAPAYAALASAPAAPEVAAESAAVAESAMLAAPTASSARVTANTPSAAPASPVISAPMATALPTLTATPIEATAVEATAVEATVAEAAMAETATAANLIATASPATALPPASTTALPVILPWLQLAALVGMATFGILWWRSRRA